MRLMILVFVLAAFVLGAMRSMAQVTPANNSGAGPCDLPLAERPDTCTGNAPTITPPESTGTRLPQATARPDSTGIQPTPTMNAYPVLEPGETPGPDPYPICNENYDQVGEKTSDEALKTRILTYFKTILHEKLTR